MEEDQILPDKTETGLNEDLKMIDCKNNILSKRFHTEYTNETSWSFHN